MRFFEVENIFKSFDGIKAIDNLSFSVLKRKITALIGPNGAGKTTLYNIITGFLKPDKGEIYFHDIPIAYMPPHKVAHLGVARTFQNIRLCPQLTALDNVMLALKYSTGDRLWSAILRTKRMIQEDNELKAKAIDLLKMVDLANKKDSLGQDLSHGQRRLVEFARALALDPDLILLDEPMSGLFPEMIDQVKGIMRNLVKSGKTILFIEHNMEVVMDIADRIVVLDQGREIAEGIPEEIRSDEAVISAYLGVRKSANT